MLGPNLSSGIFDTLCSGIFHDLCSGILRGPDLSLLLHGSDLFCGSLRDPCLGILHDLRLGILYRLYGPDLWPCIVFGRPSLELIQRGFG